MMYIDQKYLREPVDYDEIPEKLPTIWGDAKINKDGYWRITTRKEGYYLKYVHRLIYEAEFGLTLSSQDVIHHKDGNKLNNRIDNLELMSNSEHASLHNKGEKNPLYGKYHSEQTKREMRESHGGGFPRKARYGYDKKGRQKYAVIDAKGNKIKQSIDEDVVDAKLFELLVPYKRKFGYL